MALSLDEVEARALARWQPAKPTYDAEAMPTWFHSGQAEAWASEETYTVPLAGAQGGKSAIIPYFLLREIQRAAPMVKELGYGVALLVGPTLGLLSVQTIPACERLWEHELKLGTWTHGNKPQFTFSEAGSKALLGFSAPLRVICGYGSSPNNIESVTGLCAAWDEAGQDENSELAFEALERRLLVAQSKGFGRCIFPTTPYEWGWFKTRLVDPGRAHVVSWPSWMSPLVSEESCRKRLKEGMPSWRWTMMYEGLYTRPAGVIYDCFDDAKNIIEEDGDKPWQIPEGWDVYAGQDFGDRNMAGVFIARGPDGQLVCFASYHKGHVTVKEHIANLRRKATQPTAGIAGGAPSEDDWRRDFTVAGWPIMKPPIRDVEVGISRVYRLIADGRLKFTRLGAHAVIDEINRYAREVNDAGEPIDKIADKETFHRLDALRYVCSTFFTYAESSRTPIARGKLIHV